MAHEFIMLHSALYGFINANTMALKNWKKVYKGYLGTALPDTYTTKDFLRSFTKEYAELFSGVRQDSEDPIKFAQKFIDHYKSLDIDPLTKTVVFSDNLNTEKVNEILNFCRGKIKSSFGIGTFFSNDVGVKPLNIVIKLDQVEVNGKVIPVIKLSDSTGKHTGNIEMIKLCVVSLNLMDIAEASGFLDENKSITINTKELYDQ